VTSDKGKSGKRIPESGKLKSSVFTKTEAPVSLDRFATAHGLPP